MSGTVYAASPYGLILAGISYRASASAHCRLSTQHPALWRQRVANRLANETSPYLLQHKDNPVDWYPWGEEALARARELDRPLLVSIGYSACHWCHVMAHESFEDAETASLMNDRF